MKIRIYHELNGNVRIVKVVEQGPEKGKESSMFHNLKPGSMAEVEIDAVLQHQACMKESKSESKEKDDSCNLQKFLQVYAPDMPYITVKKTASKMKISVEDAEKLGMFTPEEASAFMENYRASNRRIMEKYFNCSEDLFKTNFKNIKKWEWDSRHMCEDIIRVLGNTTISLRKENEDMQQHILELEKAIELQNENISTLKTKLKHPVRTLFQKIADSTH